MNNIIGELEKNKLVFLDLLKDVDSDMILWRQQKDKWCLLEIVCHLYDEERDDFKFRVNWILEKPGDTPPPFNPLDWVTEREYMKQDYTRMLNAFIEEREASVKWIRSLEDPQWDNSYEHKKQGPLTAAYYFNNWLAHDYLHMRQILKLKFDYLEHTSGNDLNYAGRW